MFSDDRPWRWKRHVLFWLAVFIYHVLRIGLFFPADKLGVNLLSIFQHAFFRGLVLNIPFTYIIVYFVFPKYFQTKKYIHFVFGLAAAFLLMAGISFTWITYISNAPMVNAIGFTGIWGVYRSDIIRLFGNPPLICGLFLSLKILKNWQLEQLRTETLAKENANAELELLKAQVHPHFLFNTLNNIYSFSLNRSPQAGTLVKKLSGMLKYMIDECKERFVPLEKEMSLIQDYMGLEKVRYGKKLNMEVELHGDFENKLIAPLLMIPFIENSFKHGTSQVLRHPWVKLEITCVGKLLFFNLSNSKPSVVIPNKSNKGIGLNNVKKRLQLLYPGRHQLDIYSTEDSFNVSMQLMLEDRLAVAENSFELEAKTNVYA
jgi:sensor histidine kinase YesM